MTRTGAPMIAVPAARGGVSAWRRSGLVRGDDLHDLAIFEEAVGRLRRGEDGAGQVLVGGDPVGDQPRVYVAHPGVVPDLDDLLHAEPYAYDCANDGNFSAFQESNVFACVFVHVSLYKNNKISTF